MNATENLENPQDFSMQDYMSQLLTTEALIKQEAQKKLRSF